MRYFYIFACVCCYAFTTSLSGSEVSNPATSPGLWTYSGDYLPDYDGHLFIRIANDNHDLLDIQGIAKLNGTLETRGVNQSTPPAGTIFTILNASAVSGRFSFLLNNLSQTLVLDPVYSSNAVQVKVVRDYLNPQLSPSLTPNEIALGGMLNRVVPLASSDLDVVLTEIDSLATHKLVASVYDQLNPRVATIQATLAISEATLQSKNLIRRMQLLRQGFQKNNTNTIGMESEETSLFNDDCKRIFPSFSFNDRLGCFLTGKVLLGSHKKTHLQDAYQTTTTGLTAGVDYEFFDNLFTGLMTGYSHSHAHLDKNAGDVNVNEYLIGVYGTGRIQKLWFDTLFTYSRNNYSTKRNIRFGNINRYAKAHSDGYYASAYLDIGRTLCLCNWMIEPMGSLQYTAVSVGSYCERGADSLNLRVHNQFVQSVQGSLGGSVNRDFEVAAFRVLSTVRCFYIHEFKNKSPRVRASFDTAPFSVFDTHSGAKDKDFALIGLSLSTLIKEKLMAYFDYDAEVIRQDYFVQSFNLGVRGVF